MKVLHTADWHLGKKLEQSERTEEHQDFLDWLIATLDAEQIDVLIVAGDIFDSGSPSNVALEQYYRFLRKVKNTCCHEVIIIGGNHDSISTLNAPKELLKYYGIHIIGGVPDAFNEQVIEIKDAQGNVSLVVCAVPFLRDRDLRLSVSGETTAERETRIRKGISDHYNRFSDLVAVYKDNGIPVIATGHLFAAGATSSESEKEIHVGNLGRVAGDQFPGAFDYIALGHIHKPQLVNQFSHIRYCGSPIPLSFSETVDRKQVVILSFEKGKDLSIISMEVPCCRKLIRIRGDLQKVSEKLLVLEDQLLKYPHWVEVQVTTDSFIYDLDTQLQQLVAGKASIGKLFTRQLKTRPSESIDMHTEATTALHDLHPADVFLKKCLAEFGDTGYDDLLETFSEAMQLMLEEKGEAPLPRPDYER